MFTVIVALGFATFVLDVVYPLARPAHLLPADADDARVSCRYSRAATASLVVGALVRCWLRRCVAVRAVRAGAVHRGRHHRGHGRARPLSVPALQPPSWDYPFGTDRQGRDLLAVMVAGTPLTLRIGFIAGFLGVGIGTVLAFIAALLSRHGRYRDPRHRRYRPDRARPAGADHHRRVGEGQPDGEPDGDRRRLARLAQSDAHDPRPGADAARARLCRDGAAERHERAGDHLARADAEPAALSRRHAGQRGLRRDPGLDRPGGAGPRPDRSRRRWA